MQYRYTFNFIDNAGLAAENESYSNQKMIF